MKKIICIDDNQQIAELMQEMLKDIQIESESFYDPVVALDELANRSAEEFAAFICDLSMPNMEGVELIKHLRKRYPDKQIIVFSGSQEGKLMEEQAYKAGANIVIPKPYIENLLEYITEKVNFSSSQLAS
jgi:CheY-like chemotaxis protein